MMQHNAIINYIYINNNTFIHIIYEFSKSFTFQIFVLLYFSTNTRNMQTYFINSWRES